MNFGICGYGNLGKAVEELLVNSKTDKLIGVFSRRIGVKSISGTPVYPFNQMCKFKGKIDVMVMCGGSQEDLIWQSAEALNHFNIIDTFDTHARIQEHRVNLERVSNKSRKSAIYSCGWDPGLFSLIRMLAGNIFMSKPEVFWGKGVSQGHSEALRNVKGVKDAIQFTVPNKEIFNTIKKDCKFKPDENEKHKRICFVCIDGTRAENEIEEEIKNTPNYFKGQNVVVNFCSLKKVKQLKQKMYHQGFIFAGDEKTRLEFNVKMDSNPHFTAQIVLAYAYALGKLDVGVYSVADIPLALICQNDNMNYL